MITNSETRIEARYLTSACNDFLLDLKAPIEAPRLYLVIENKVLIPFVGFELDRKTSKIANSIG